MSYLSPDFSARVHLGADLDEGRSHAEVLQQLRADVFQNSLSLVEEEEEEKSDWRV